MCKRGGANARTREHAKVRQVPIPSEGLGINIVCDLEQYLRLVGPPSGGYLLAAPLGSGKFRITVYSAHSRAFQAAYKRAHPVLALQPGKLEGIGGGTPRKSMAQWRYRVRHSKWVIVDICGWSHSDRDVADVYFGTEHDTILGIERSQLQDLRGMEAVAP